MLLKSAQDGGIVSWGNCKQNSCSFATGSFTQNDRSTLRIFNYDTGYKDTNPTLVGWSEAPSIFNSLSWDNFGLNENYPLGVVAGGMNDGSCVLWDVAQLMEQSQTAEYNPNEINYHGCISVIDSLFEGPVTTMEFNPFKPNLLAVGGQDVLVINIEKDIVQPQIFSPGSPNLHGDHSITSVSWNRKVQHILASASQNGLTVVWDLKINKSIFSFQDSSAMLNRKVSLAWNPEIPTQIAVTYDDERVPELQIWDLRNPQGPVVVFNQAHSSGINCLSWCPSDQSLILTAGRDKQIICWNYKTQQIVKQEQVDFDIADLKWSNKVSGVYACTGQDSHTDIRSLEGATEGYAPKWFKPPVGAHFGPSGGLITFRENSGNVLTQYSPKPTLKDHDLDSFDKFIELSQGDHKLRISNELQYFQEAAGEGTEFDFEHEQWRLVQALYSDDLAEYLQTLGFNRKDITAQTENYTGKRHNKKTEESKGIQQQTNKPQKNTYDFATLSTQDAESFFDQLTTASIQKEQKKDLVGTTQKTEKEIYIMEQISKNVNWDAGVEKIIKDNLIIGNYDGAIDCALKSGRSAEALLLAYSQGKETFEQTMEAYLTSQTDFFLKNVVRNIVEKQYEEIAKTYELKNWKECVAIILSAGTTKQHSERFSKIMIQLGDRFLNEKKDEQNALLCFILSENLDRCMQFYLKQLEQFNPRTKEFKRKLTNIFKICLELRDMPGSNGNGTQFKQGLDYLALQLSYKALAMQRPLTAYHALHQGGGLTLKTNKIKDLLFNGPYQNEIRKFYEDSPAYPYKRDICNAQRLQVPQQVIQQQTSNNNTRGAPQPIKKNQIFEQPSPQVPIKGQHPQGQQQNASFPDTNRPQSNAPFPQQNRGIPPQVQPPVTQKAPTSNANLSSQRQLESSPPIDSTNYSSSLTSSYQSQNQLTQGQGLQSNDQQKRPVQNQSQPFGGLTTQTPPQQAGLQKSASNQQIRPNTQRPGPPPPSRPTPPPPSQTRIPSQPQQQAQQPPQQQQTQQSPVQTFAPPIQRPQPQSGSKVMQPPPPVSKKY